MLSPADTNRNKAAVYLRIPVQRLVSDVRYTTASLEVRGAFFGLLCLLRSSERPGWLPRFLVIAKHKGSPSDSRQAELVPPLFVSPHESALDGPHGSTRVDIDWARLAQILGGTPERIRQCVTELIRSGLLKIDSHGELHDPDIAAAAEHDASVAAARSRSGVLSGVAKRERKKQKQIAASESPPRPRAHAASQRRATADHG